MVTQDIITYAGSQFSGSYIANSDSSTPINLSGYSLKGNVKWRVSNSGVILALSPISTNSAAGTVGLLISGSQTSGLAPGQYQYDLSIYSGGFNYRFQQGAFYIEPAVTF